MVVVKEVKVGFGGRNWVRLFKSFDRGLPGGAKPEPKFEREVCVREAWQDLSPRDAERQRRRGTRRPGCGRQNGLVSSGPRERWLM